MHPSIVIRILAASLLVLGCTGPRDEPPSPGTAATAETAAVDEHASGAAASSAASQDGSLLMQAQPREPGIAEHVTTTEIVVPETPLSGEGVGVLRFEAFGPAPGTTPEQFEEWTGLVRERFLGQPSPERLIVLDSRLEEVPVIDATPVFINALLGLDMADPEDIVRAGAITEWWYLQQIRYKQVILDADPEALLPINVRNRMLVVDGWIRMWKRTLQSEGGVERLRARVAQLHLAREKARAKQQREYEEKLRRRAEEAGEQEEQGQGEGDDGP